MDWYKVTLSADDVQLGKQKEIMDQFLHLFEAAGFPKEMALFSSWFLQDNIVELYFSSYVFKPLQTLIKLYSGVRCEKPTKDNVSLLVGHDESWKLLD